MGNKSGILIALIILFIALNIADIITTTKATKKGAREVNPLIRFLLTHHLFIPTKVIITLVIAVILFCLPEGYALSTAFICCSIYVFVVINNIHELKSLKAHNKGEMSSDGKRNI